MTAEIGLYSLTLALFAALYQAVFPLIGAGRGDQRLMDSGKASAAALVFFVGFGFAALTFAHAISDFSVRNVAENSHTAKPFLYKLTGVWGNHEGSMLLWVLILAIFGGAVAAARGPVEPLRARALAVQGMIAAAFLLFVLFASNPFVRLWPPVAEGLDLNPLLQDPGLAIHPPFLYLGYVGFSVAFAYAAAGLIGGRIDQKWAEEARPYALSAFVFLTIGIALGSWWAYYELGWGGYWAWDPVENASFMPWLAGLALIHMLRATQMRGVFGAWTAFLAILTFSLSLIGTFLVRSGILTSVHAFAVDPTRGQFILAILGVTIGGGFSLFALRGPALQSGADYAPVSREGALLVNTAVLIAAAATVFIGTFYPLFVELATGAKLSVGAPYFNIVFAPFALLTFALMGIGVTMGWRRADLTASLRFAAPALMAGGGAALAAFTLVAPRSAAGATAAGFAIFALVSMLMDAARRARAFEIGGFQRLAALPSAYKGMAIAHIGVAVFALGAIGAGVWKRETIAYVDIGGEINVGEGSARLVDVTQGRGPNYDYEAARFALSGAGEGREIVAERRFYPVRAMQTTEAGIASDWTGDVYIALGERRDGKGWAVRAWRHPLVVWMWTGAGLVALGGVIALGVRKKGASFVGAQAPQAG